jgi:hypothetical protein
MVIGSLLTPWPLAAPLEAELTKILRDAGHSGGEVKWTKCRLPLLDAYQKFVDRLLVEIAKERIWFHAMVLKTAFFNHARFNEGDGELGFNKFFYHHLLKYSRLKPAVHLHVHPDSKRTHYDLMDLRAILNRGAAKSHGAVDPFRFVGFMDSESSRLIQAADVLAGCIAYVLNERGLRPEAAPAKKALAEYIQSKKSVVPPFDVSTPRHRKAFNIWHFHLK